jgi:hypothetical protein
MASAEAREEAARIFRQITPALHYLADQAPLIAVRPMALLDAAQLLNGESGSRVRWAAGGGIQMVIVVARFEAGYAKNISPAAGEPTGNFFARLVFRNLF